MTVRLVLGMFLVAAAMPASATVVLSGTGSIANTDSVNTVRLNRDGVTSSWASPKAFPGVFGTTGTYYYDLVNVAVAQNALAPIWYEISFTNITTSSPHATAYNGSFTPANLSTNYLGDSGVTPFTGNTVSFQVVVPTGGSLLLHFGSPSNAGGFGDYSYSVSAFGSADRTPLPGSNVPEPASWAMLIIGFGLTGAIARRRRILA